MKKVLQILQKKTSSTELKKVAAYARVSVETKRLHHSFSNQINYYRSLILSHPEWDFVGIYADEGITGTLTKKRMEFCRLLSDCEEGKIDIILTKSISRFARNTLELLSSVRRLKELGVSVRFEKEGIDSLSADGEIMLTLLASFAQEEICSMSNNVKWSIRKNFASGNPVTHCSIFGYRWEGKQLVVVPEEARIIRYIFHNILYRKTRAEILRALNKSGIKTRRGNSWSSFSLTYILTNIVYTGNLLLQKTFISDPIKKQRRINKGELPQYFVKDHHEPIIDMKTFYQVQKKLHRISQNDTQSQN